MSLLLDAGGLIALERGDRRLWSTLTGLEREGVLAAAPGVVVAQVWRGGSSQARSAAWNAATSSPFSTWWNVLEQSRTYAVHGSPGGTTLLEASRKLAPYNRVVRPFRFGVNVWTAASRAAWQDKARRLEALG